MTETLCNVHTNVQYGQVLPITRINAAVSIAYRINFIGEIPTGGFDIRLLLQNGSGTLEVLTDDPILLTSYKRGVFWLWSQGVDSHVVGMSIARVPGLGDFDGTIDIAICEATGQWQVAALGA